MNSMGVSPFVNRLYSDLQDGLILFQLYEIIQPGCVDQKRICKQFKKMRATFEKIGALPLPLYKVISFIRNIKFSMEACEPSISTVSKLLLARKLQNTVRESGYIFISINRSIQHWIEVLITECLCECLQLQVIVTVRKQNGKNFIKSLWIYVLETKWGKKCCNKHDSESSKYSVCVKQPIWYMKFIGYFWKWV